MHRKTVIYLLALVCTMTSSAKTARLNEMTFSRLTTIDGLSDNHVMDITQLSDGRLAIATWGSVNLYDGSQFTHVPLTSSSYFSVPKGKAEFHMGIDAEERIWVKRTTELWCFDLRRGRYVENFDSLFTILCPQKESADLPVEVFVDARKQLWIITHSKLFDVEHGQKLNLPKDFKEVCAVETDKTGIWVFNGAGRCILFDRITRRLIYDGQNATIDEAEKYWNIITLRGSDGTFYHLFGGRQSMLFSFNPKTKERRQLFILDCFVRSMDISPDRGELWLNTRHGINVLSLNGQLKSFINRFPLKNDSELDSRDVNSAFFDSSDNLWLAMTDRGLLFHHNCSHSMTSGETAADVNVPETLSEFFRHRRALQYNPNKYHDNNDELTDSRGWMWEATTRGLRLAKPQQSTLMLGEASGLPSNYIQSLTEDKQGDIWIATSNGIARLSIAADSTFRITNFDESDGCLSGGYYSRSATCLPDGRIVMEGVDGWMDGWTVFHPKQMVKHSQALTPLLTGINVNSVTLHAGLNADGILLEAEPPYARYMELCYDQNQLVFDFSAFNYAHPLQTSYRWRLAQWRDTTWHRANHHDTPSLVDADGALHLSMIQLPPGHYRLEVEASTDGEHFPGGRATFGFRIHPPWWLAWWAYTLYILIALGAIGWIAYAYIRYQRRKLEWKRQKEVLQLRIRHLLEQAELQPINQSETAEAKEDSPQEENSLSEQDNEFIQSVVANIEQHLNETYTVEQLASDMCMERTGLYKRLTTLIDQSPQTFIRSIRLQRAADLLHETDRSISDIAYSVGFTSLSYLVKCFREKYGCTPGEWREQQK